MKNPIAIVAALLLSGCAATSFDNPPIAATGCDPNASGSWLSIRDKADGDGESARLLIDANCQLVFEEIRHSTTMASGPVQLHLGQHAGKHYAWFDTNWLLAVGDVESRIEPSGFVVVRYALDGNRLKVWHMDGSAVDRLHDEGLLVRSSVDGDGHDELRRITGPANPAVLEQAGLFHERPRQFKRERRKP